ncbi:hypothetical protein A6S26_25060 [Nostoc sp. ATCC 43529]|nr:hypothetical protein A6S26_25060 [Nostoc sp. ATCC 43529]
MTLHPKNHWDVPEQMTRYPKFRVFDSNAPQLWEWIDSKTGNVYQIYDYPRTYAQVTESEPQRTQRTQRNKS